jgi:hypothetical protein
MVCDDIGHAQRLFLLSKRQTVVTQPPHEQEEVSRFFQFDVSRTRLASILSASTKAAFSSLAVPPERDIQ